MVKKHKADNANILKLNSDFYTLGPLHTGQRKANEILAKLNSFDIFSYK